MSGVRYSSLTNSTLFTDCCDTAICDHQQKCPRCGKDVYPFYEGMTDGDRAEAAGGYFNHNTQRARHNQAHKRPYAGF
jgi:hypothetical protein